MIKSNKAILFGIALTCSVAALSGCSGDKENTSETVTDSTVNDFIENPVAAVASKFEFKPQKVKGKVERANPAESTKTVKLYLGNSIYYPIEVPMDLDIITDNSKYIYAKDSSINISILSNTDMNNFSEFVGIQDSETIKHDLIRGKDKKNKPQEAAKAIANGKTVVVRAYNNPVAFETVFRGLENNTYSTYQCEGLTIDENHTQIMDKLPTYTGYHVTVNPGLADEIQNIYNFNDGSLTVSKEIVKPVDAIAEIGSKAAIVNGDTVADKIYSIENCYYAEQGNYTVAVVSVNFNTSITLFGNGEEARFNIVAFLDN